MSLKKFSKATHAAAAHVEVGVQLNAKRQNLFDLFRCGGGAMKMGGRNCGGQKNSWRGG